MPTVVLAADDVSPVFIFAGGSNISGGTLEVGGTEERANALFFDGTQWGPVSPEKVNKRGVGPKNRVVAIVSLFAS